MQSILLHASNIFTPPTELETALDIKSCAITWITALGNDLDDEAIATITYHLLRTLRQFPVPADFLAQVENLPALTKQYRPLMAEAKPAAEAP